jgi:hypothetical protein
MKPSPAQAAIAYVTAAVLCFGASYNLDYQPGHSLEKADNTMRAAICGMLWPFWLSAKAFEGLRPMGGTRP